jgi:hypothetical protein
MASLSLLGSIGGPSLSDAAAAAKGLGEAELRRREMQRDQGRGELVLKDRDLATVGLELVWGRLCGSEPLPLADEPGDPFLQVLYGEFLIRHVYLNIGRSRSCIR